MKNCLFCNIGGEKERIVFKDDLIMMFPTNIPIVPGHILVCPTRHVDKFDQLTEKELQAIE